MNSVNTDNNLQNEVSAGEIFYCLFFGMLLFAKGIGLYDGQGVFKVFLIAALLCWGIKMCLTRWTVKEVLIVGLLVFLGFVSWHTSGEKAALISVLVVTGMKDVSVKKVFRIGLVIWTACFIGTVTLALTEMIEPLKLVHDKAGLGYVVRNSLGYTHPNVLHITYVILMAFWFHVFSWKEKSVWKAVFVAFLGNVYIFLYSLSYTGFAMTVAYLILIVYFSVRRRRTKVEDVMIQCLMPVCVITAIFAPLLLKGRIFEVANKIVNTRFELTRRYLTNWDVTLWGTPVVMNRGSIDCSYVYCLLYYGLVLFLLFMIGYFFLIRHLLKENRLGELAMVLGLVAAGFTEPFQFNFSFKNLILPLLGEYLFEILARRNCRNRRFDFEIQILPLEKKFLMPKVSWEKKVAVLIRQSVKKGKLWITAGCIIGMILGGVVGAVLLPTESYLVVNKSYSDRVGEKEDYLIFGELSEEIINQSDQIKCDGPDTKVYVFEGSTVEMEHFRDIVTLALACGAVGGLAVSLVFVFREKKRPLSRQE